jgi:hypothetical protein
MMDRSVKKQAQYVVLSVVFLATGVFGSVIFVTLSIFSNYHINHNEIDIQTKKINVIRGNFLSLALKVRAQEKQKEIEIELAHKEYLDEVHGISGTRMTGVGEVAASKKEKIRFLEYEKRSMGVIEEQYYAMLMLQTDKYNALKSKHFGVQLFLSSTLGFLLAIAMLSIKKLYSVDWSTWSIYLNCYLPDEVIGELWALRKQLIDNQKTIPQIQNILFCKILESIWAFHVQIRIDNLSLPAKKQRTDD